jgi:hypothetical protein
MTTQAVKVSIKNADGSQMVEFECTSTDDSWNDLLDSVNSDQLWEAMRGQRIVSYMGYYTAGAGILRVYNKTTNKVKALGCIHMIKGQVEVAWDRPFTVQDQDILQVLTTVAGS